MPAPPEQFHFIGVCGRAMSAIAIALARSGHRVTGSDESPYGTSYEELQAAGIPVFTSYTARQTPADAVIVAGKRVTEDNPEILAALRSGRAIVSFPSVLRDRFLSRSRNAVVAGGVGKTTTTAMLAWILEHAGLGPDYLIGGSALNFSSPARFAGSSITVLEGDEYASCFDDCAAKFLHYAPEIVVVTNLIEDHPDLYPTIADLRQAFVSLIELLPATGGLVVSADDPEASRLASPAGARTRRVGFDAAADVPIERVALTASGSAFALGGARFMLPLFGPMNVRNAAMAAVAAEHFGVSLDQSADSLAAFRGVNNRQEGRAAGRRTLVTDKASHPESLKELARALRQQYPRRRLVSVIEPRATGGRQWIYQRDLPEALGHFDAVVLARAYEHRPPRHTAWARDPFSMTELERAIRARGVPVISVPSLDELPEAVAASTADGDVVLLTLREQHGSHADAVHAALSGPEQPAPDLRA